MERGNLVPEVLRERGLTSGPRRITPGKGPGALDFLPPLLLPHLGSGRHPLPLGLLVRKEGGYCVCGKNNGSIGSSDA